MCIPLEKEQQPRALNLVETLDAHYPMLKSTILDKKEGTVYVDDPENPEAAAVLSQDGWFYLLGESQDETFYDQLLDLVVHTVTEKQIPVSWFGMSEGWKKVLEETADLEIQDYPRVRYTFDEARFQANKALQPALEDSRYEERPLTSDLVPEVFANRKRLYAYWKDEKTFERCGFGRLLIDGENSSRIVAQVLTAAVEEEEIEVDVYTMRPYRLMGMAHYLSVQFIEDCLKREKVPKWDCSVHNEPSNRLAQRLGFVPVREYPFSLVTPKES